ncbi:MAG TPA: Sir2 family NAD-dependent protein deacetylase, partial [Actinomycetes bacterium]|nr:Sir2 family NAD-dependent protein deacetylase [Actinomycetes bacterium]
MRTHTPRRPSRPGVGWGPTLRGPQCQVSAWGPHPEWASGRQLRVNAPTPAASYPCPMDLARPSTRDALERAAALLARARRIVIFSGAGISTESGIPDFRSPGGIWTRYDPRQLGFRRYMADPEARKLAWRLRRELHHMDARPNPAHLACVRLAEAGRLAGVITQNIDGL